MSQQQVRNLEQTITYLKYARHQAQLALGNTDAFQDIASEIDGLIAEIGADIAFLQDVSPNKTVDEISN